MKYRSILILACITVFLLTHCEKEEEPVREYPRITTLNVEEIDGSGATFYAEINSLGTEGILEYGFVWGIEADPTPKLENSDRLSIFGTPKLGILQKRISTTLYENVNYKIRSYVKNNTYTVYGNEVLFLSLGSSAPIINEIQPPSAVWGDTLMIIGRNFSYKPGINRVLFGSDIAEVCKQNDTTLHVLVPGDLRTVESDVSVSIYGNKTVHDTKFKIDPPEIYRIFPDTAYLLDTVNILGKNFHSGNLNNLTKVNGFSCQVISSNDTLVTFIVPENIGNGPAEISVEVFGQADLLGNGLYVSAPKVNTLSAMTGSYGDTLMITGTDFHPEFAVRKFLFGSVEATLLEWTQSLITVIVPPSLLTRNSEVGIELDGRLFTFNKSFSLNEPIITTVNPVTIQYGDTITIYGDFFNPIRTNNAVNFNLAPGEVLNATRNQLRVKIPFSVIPSSGMVDIDIVIGDMAVQSTAAFSIPAPEITGFLPDSGIVGDTLIIVGKNFNPITINSSVSIGPNGTGIIGASRTEIKVIIPFSTDPAGSDIRLNVNEQLCSAQTNLYLKKPQISSINPQKGHRGSLVTIKGINFSSNPNTQSAAFNKVTVNNSIAIQNLVATSSDSLSFTFPEDYSITNIGLNSIKVEVGVQSVTDPVGFQRLEPFTKVFTLPGNDLWQWVSCSYNNKIYIGLGYGNRKFYEFDPLSNTLKSLTDFPLSSDPANAVAFSFGDTIYVCNGSYFYAYLPQSDTWIEKSGSPTINAEAVAMVINNRVYIGLGEYSQVFWEYNPYTGVWNRKADWPNATSYSPWYFSVADKGYVGSEWGYIWEYDPATDTWTQKSGANSGFRRFGVFFAVNGKGYVGTGQFNVNNLDDMWMYDPALDNWTRIVDFPLPIEWGFGVSTGSKGYIGGGHTTYSNKDLYEFDPSKLIISK